MTGESRSEALAPTRLFLVRSTAGQRQQDAPIKRQKTYLKNLGKMLTILPFSYLYNLFKKTRKIVVKLLLNFR